jgi:hypothetical protein
MITMRRQPSTATRRREIAKRLCLSWLIIVGPAGDGCVSIIQAHDGGDARAVREEARRLRAWLIENGEAEIAGDAIEPRAALCVSSGRVASELRAAVVAALAPGRAGGEPLRVSAAAAERAIREAARARRVRIVGAAEREAMIDREMLAIR